MSSRNEAELFADAKKLGEVLPKIDSKLPDGLKAPVLAGAASDFETAVATVKRINAERTKAVDDKDVQVKALRELLKRVRDGVRAAYGDDSPEYEMVGGKRRSERKRRVRTTTPA